MGDILSTLQEEDPGRLYDFSKFNDLGDAGVFHSESLGADLGVFQSGIKRETKYSFWGNVETTWKSEVTVDFKAGKISGSTDGETHDISIGRGPLSGSIDSEGKLGATLSTPIGSKAEAGLYAESTILEKIIGVWMALDTALTASIRAESFKSATRCFPAGTMIVLGADKQIAIEKISNGTRVVARARAGVGFAPVCQ